MHISSKCSIAVHCLIFLHEFGDSNRVTSELLSLSTGCNPVSIRNIMSALKKGGMISVRQGTGGAALDCRPEEITLYRVCSAVDPNALNKMIGVHPSPSPFCPVGRNIHAVLEASYETVREDLKKSLQSVTLQDILDQYHHAVPEKDAAKQPKNG